MEELKTPQRPKTVLVVDDDAEIREVLATMLSEEGYVVRTAINGHDALATLEQSEQPGIILLDLTMPVMDGNSFVSQLNARVPGHTIPIVVVSAVAHRAEKGIVGIVDKPIDFETLLAYVRRYCGPVH